MQVNPNQIEKFFISPLSLSALEVQYLPYANVLHWCHFVKNLYDNSETVPNPFPVVAKLAKEYLHSSSLPVLDIGCETGKNALVLARAGHRVSLVDIAPNAIQYTLKNLKKDQLDDKIADTFAGSIESINPIEKSYEAVVGTYTFPFIKPEDFTKVMTKNVLKQVAIGGYFAGGFFGPDHSWARDPDITIMTVEKIRYFFQSRGFILCEINEVKKEIETVLEGKQLFHTISLIAKRIK